LAPAGVVVFLAGVVAGLAVSAVVPRWSDVTDPAGFVWAAAVPAIASKAATLITVNRIPTPELLYLCHIWSYQRPTRDSN
jgi:hypothetical protein